MNNSKRSLGSPMMLVWPWWKAEEAGKGKHTDDTNSSPRNVPVFPLEIIDRILREACEWPLRRAERQVLTAGTLVCKSWLPLARCLLYHSLIVEAGHFNFPRDPGIFVPEELFQQSHLLGFTRSLSIHVLDKYTATMPLFSEGDGPEGSQECVRIPDFFFLLAHTPGLRYLELSFLHTQNNVGPVKSHILNWLSSLVLPVEALHLNDVVRLHSNFVYDLVTIWPTIRALRVVANKDGLPPERPNISLRELSLPVTSLDSIIEVIEWLLPPPPPNQQSNLQFLELYGIPKEALPVLSIHGPSVSTLTLTLKPTFEFAHLFTKLEELVITGRFWSSPLPAFPKTLKHIRLQVHHPGFMSNSVLAAISQVVPTLPDLRILSVEEALTAYGHYPDLQEVCETHRVEILVNSVDSSERTHPYHVEMKRFPRQFAFSDFFDVGDRGL